jgi:hypothetical protein
MRTRWQRRGGSAARQWHSNGSTRNTHALTHTHPRHCTMLRGWPAVPGGLFCKRARRAPRPAWRVTCGRGTHSVHTRTTTTIGQQRHTSSSGDGPGWSLHPGWHMRPGQAATCPGAMDWHSARRKRLGLAPPPPQPPTHVTEWQHAVSCCNFAIRWCKAWSLQTTTARPAKGAFCEVRYGIIYKRIWRMV